MSASNDHVRNVIPYQASLMIDQDIRLGEGTNLRLHGDMNHYARFDAGRISKVHLEQGVLPLRPERTDHSVQCQRHP